jgi:tRNA (adenine37-N6)-methyltransferase
VRDDAPHVGFTVRPVGLARTAFTDKAETPRQPGASAAETREARIELLPELADAARDLSSFDRVWILFWFDRAHPEGHAPAFPGPTRVTPPRSDVKRGVFATRSPHRPNAIGMSCVRLLGVDGHVVRVADLDVLDGTPVIDIKPYIPYADAFPDASSGWLEARDPIAAWVVVFSERAREQLDFLADEGRDLEARAAQALALGPEPHAYRRIRAREDGARVLSVKAWRVTFTTSEADHAARRVVVTRVDTGYRERELERNRDPALDVHRAFVAAFGPPAR